MSQGDAAIVVFFVEYSLGGFVALTFEDFFAAHAASTSAAARACIVALHLHLNESIC